MNKISHTAITIILSATLLQACSNTKPVSYVTPESLIDVSSERVTFSLSSPSAREDIASWVAKDKPSRAEMQCSQSDLTCGIVAASFERTGVPQQFAEKPGAQPKVVLIYDRLVARACENRFIDNSFNPLNLNHPALGCSVSTNNIQAVSNRSEFTNPPLMDYQDAEKAVQAYRKAQEPAKPGMAPPPPPPAPPAPHR